MKKYLAGSSREEIVGNSKNLSTEIETLINNVVQEIFTSYGQILIKSSTEFIISAIWGVGMHESLNPMQKSIHTKINPVVDGVIQALKLHEVNPSQQMAVNYLIRNLISSKLMHMVDLLRLVVDKGAEEQDIIKMLMDVEAVGHA